MLFYDFIIVSYKEVWLFFYEIKVVFFGIGKVGEFLYREGELDFIFLIFVFVNIFSFCRFVFSKF